MAKFASLWLMITFVLSFLTGCTLFSQNKGSAQSQTQTLNSENSIIAVDAAIARLGTLSETLEYIGTTKPLQEVSLRSQVEGRLISLKVDVGDRVNKGQLLAQLDDSLLVTAVNQAKAELAALESELARAKAQVNNARTQLQKTEVELEQAENDAVRFSSLAEEGAISQQEAENSQTIAKVAQKTVLSAQEQIKIEEKAVAAVKGRIAAQKAVIAEEEQRQSYSRLYSPINGVVLQRASEPGNLITPVGEVLKLGDFSQVKIIVPVSELVLSNLKIGQSVNVTLDAFKTQKITGRISRIFPVANNLQVPIEVIIPNVNRQINSGLLARVSFKTQSEKKIIVPESAIIEKENQKLVFVIDREIGDRQAKVEARKIKLGTTKNEQVEILSGINTGEKFIINSSKPLNNGDIVRLSIISD